MIDLCPSDLIDDADIKQLVFAYESILTEMRTHSADPLIRGWVNRLDYERDEFVQVKAAVKIKA